MLTQTLAILLPLLSSLTHAAPAPQNSIPLDITLPIRISDSPSLPAPTASLPLTTSLNIPITTAPSGLPSLPLPTGSWNMTRTRTSRKKWSHWEPIPIFTSSCDCPNLATVARPCWVTDALAACNFEELHSLVCWTKAGRGCPYPTKTCADLYKPTPVTGKHPCDMSPDRPSVTSEAVLTTDAPVTSTAPKTSEEAKPEPTEEPEPTDEPETK